MKSTIELKPFLKWAVGKSQLLNEIQKYYPSTIEKYYHLFVGLGIGLFDMLSKFQLREVLINDINPKLTSCYTQIKNNVDELITLLSQSQSDYMTLFMDDKKHFAETQTRLNKLIFAKDNSVEKAALMVYPLNKIGGVDVFI